MLFRSGATLTWSLSGPGSIDAAGLYTAGGEAGSATVTASFGGVGASATVTILAPAPTLLEIEPVAATADPGAVIEFSAVVLDASGVALDASGLRWSVTGSGTIEQSGRFTAAASTAGNAASVTAALGDLSATARVTITPRVATTLVVSPTDPTLSPGGQVRLVASVLDQNGEPIAAQPTWSLDGPGTIDAEGRYGAASDPAGGTALVTANAGGLFATVAILISPSQPASVVITPPAATVRAGGTQQFVAKVLDLAGLEIKGAMVTWSAQGAGTVDQTGSFTADPLGAGHSATVRAGIGGLLAEALVTVTP